jgi:hypothetical protein
MDDPRRRVPRTDALLAEPALVAAAERLGRELVKGAVQSVQQRVREGRLAPDDAIDAVLRELPATASSLRRVLNATGVLVHTNLGRAPLSPAAVEAVVAASGTTPPAGAGRAARVRSPRSWPPSPPPRPRSWSTTAPPRWPWSPPRSARAGSW